ncbi:MAG: hypothetical protein C6P37_14840 [Caldibacillus debilis]|uniref:Uncharacterized protein n=1 Tax=Caldibacillus debilis TaxID=301148 RepID=A0A3E0JYT4_9BACI|nr:MAG: hypothetical protein C6P37_14840 [Caldibacillus debilis]
MGRSPRGCDPGERGAGFRRLSSAGLAEPVRTEEEWRGFPGGLTYVEKDSLRAVKFERLSPAKGVPDRKDPGPAEAPGSGI